ncbi:MAG: ABC transporter permease [Caldilineaceae bacterium]|nr:ABC transporter permease [Caldilineaceae bacterium]
MAEVIMEVEKVETGTTIQLSESYFQLVWRRFRRSKPAIIGGLIVLLLGVLAIFAEFFAPYPLNYTNARDAFIPPSRIRLIDYQGNLHLRPFVYPLVVTVDPKTFVPDWTEDYDKIYPIRFFVRGWEYKLLGLIPMDLHLFGVEEGGNLYLLGTDKLGADLWSKAGEAGRISLSMSIFGTLVSVIIGAAVGVVSGYYGGWFDNITQRFVEFLSAFPQLALWLSLAAIVPRTWDSFRIFLIMAFIFALLSWTTLAREVRGKILSLRETDFVLAAKEMGASDARIMFLHLLPNTFSHIIVVLTLTIPGIILAEAFLSFLGIGIQRPLISWGLLMQDAQNLRTLGETPWIMTPALYIIAAVLGFNLLGDGLRDAADPYAIS